jgi:hypothetical protein
MFEHVTNTFPSTRPGNHGKAEHGGVLVSYNELEYENEFVDDDTDYSTFMQLCFHIPLRSVRLKTHKKDTDNFLCQ